MNLRVTQALSSAETNELIALHRSAFPGFFLTSLGPAFLNLLYHDFVTMPEGLCILALDEDKVVGFAAGALKPEAFFRELRRRHWLRFALAALPGLLRNPVWTARKCLGALFYSGESLQNLPDAALLSSLAVSPAFQGHGTGSALVAAFIKEARERGCKAVYLTTDEANNEAANRFYAKCGFDLRDSFKRQGNRTMNRWVVIFQH